MTYTIEQIKAMLDAVELAPINKHTRESFLMEAVEVPLFHVAPTIIRELLEALEKAKRERNVARKEVQACNRKTHGQCGND